MNCKFTQVFTALLVLGLSSCQYCSAQAACNGVLTGTFNNGVICVGGGNCTLDGATVSGNIVCSSGTLLVTGSSFVTGSVLLDGQITSAELDAVTVLGSVQATDAGSLIELVITDLATVGQVSVTNSPNAEVSVGGTLQGLDLVNSGSLIANNLITTATVSVNGGNGVIEICGSSLGGLLVTQYTGTIEIDATAPNCDPSTITTGLTASKGFGQVTVIGATLTSGDFIVSEYIGNIILQNIPTVSDIKSEKNSGSLTISSVTTDSDTSIIEQVGNIVLQDSTFAFEDVSIVFVTGTVSVLRNNDLSLTAENINGEVTVTDNTIDVGKINKNTGGVLINNNVFTSLSCTDNVPAPNGSNNVITFGDGQCSTGL